MTAISDIPVPAVSSVTGLERVPAMQGDVEAGIPFFAIGNVPRGEVLALGRPFLADTSATSDADPGAGNVRWNNATQASATMMFIDDVDTAAASIASILASLEVGGLLYLQGSGVAGAGTWQKWQVTSNTDAVGYTKIGVSLVASAGSFADNAALMLSVQQPEDSGAGDVVGPASSGDSYLSAFDGTTGKLLKQAVNGKVSGSLEVIATGTQADVTATTYGVDGGGIMHGRYARGTEASPSAVLAGDIFGGFGCRAYHSGGAFQNSSPTSLHWVASENHTSTAYGSYLRVLTTPKGSTTRVERVIVSDTGTLWCHGNGTFDPKVEAQTKPVSDVLVLASASGTSENASVGSFVYGTGTPGFRGGQASGTAASPSATATTRILAFMGGHGHDGTNWTAGTKAILAFYSAEAFTGSAQGTYVTCETTPIGSTTRAEGWRLEPSGHFRPGSDNAKTLGTSSFRWSTVYAATGTINTSDAREKTDVAQFSEAETSAAAQICREIGTFRFLSAIADKGDRARIHVGLTVQRAIEVMQAHGLDPFAYAFICHDEWGEVNEPAHYETAIIEPERYIEHAPIYGGFVGKGKRKRRKMLKKGWTEVIPAVTEQVLTKEAMHHPAGDRYGFRMDQLLAFIARGFDSRLSRLEGAARL